MRVRRQGGATLGLTAACVLLVIVIGVGFYFLSKIIGGGREVANATDAGALNVAKQALKRGTVTLTAAQNAEFGSLTDPLTPGAVTLITYNRIIAQAMMVAQNAQVENTLFAQQNAQATVASAQAIGALLKGSLVTASKGALPADFNSIAGAANTKMWNGNTVACTTIATGYLKAKGSTNVIFDPATIAAFGGWSPNDLTTGPAASNSPNATDYTGATVKPGAHYMPGYDPNNFSLFNGAATVSLTGVPVFPNTKPHLVDIGTFNSDLTANASFVTDPNTSANAFHADATAVEAKSGNVGGSLACAVVGVLNRDYKASFPRGFVRINNGPDAVATNGTYGIPISDGTNDIFNNQLYGAPPGQPTPPGGTPGATGIYQDNASGVFTTNPSDLGAWGAFNARTGTLYNNSALTIPQNNAAVCAAAGITGPAWVAYGVNAAGTAYPPGAFVPQLDLPTFADPMLLGTGQDSIADSALNPVNYDDTPAASPSNETGLRWGSACGSPYATIAQLETIGTSNFNCLYSMYDDTLTGPCASVTNVDTWQSNYQQCITALPTNNGLAMSGQNQGVTNVEYLKAELLVKIAGRLGGHFCADVDIPTETPSGVKYFSRGVPGTPGSADAFDPNPADVSAGSSPVVNFETVGTTLQYLTQISNNLGPCANAGTTGILEQITARMQQIESTVTQGQVTTALGDPAHPLHLKNVTGGGTADNGTLYLYVDPTTRQVAINATLPAGWQDTTAPGMVGSSNFPDGPAPAVGSGECTDSYPLNGWVVNTQFTMTTTGKGDAHYHDQPFTQPGNASGPPTYNAPPMTTADNGGTAPIYGQDAAIFKPSSGSQNNLGVLNFTENTQGTTFCKPN